MNQKHELNGEPVLGSVAAINSILSNYEDEIKMGANYASSKHLKSVKPSSITFYFGDKVIGEVKFVNKGTKDQNVTSSKLQLINEAQIKDKNSLLGQMLFSQFCNFKIN